MGRLAKHTDGLLTLSMLMLSLLQQAPLPHYSFFVRGARLQTLWTMLTWNMFATSVLR
jgi:hypothetical protein